MACYKFLLSKLTLIVDFDGDTSGRSIVDEITPSRVGKHYSEYWITKHNSEAWEPCADPRQSRTNKILKALKENQ